MPDQPEKKHIGFKGWLGILAGISTVIAGAYREFHGDSAPNYVESQPPPQSPLGFQYLDMRISRIKDYAEKMNKESRDQGDKMDQILKEGILERKAENFELRQEQIRLRNEFLSEIKEVKNDIKELLQRTPKKGDTANILKPGSWQ